MSYPRETVIEQLRSWKGELEQYLVDEIAHNAAYYIGFASQPPE